MYQRFLNTNDYRSIVTEEALKQLVRGDEERLSQAEEAAEQSVLEYLTENYEIEKVLAAGKNLQEYSRLITYPAGSHFYLDGKIYQATRVINGVKSPFAAPYWEVEQNLLLDGSKVMPYSQRLNYSPGDIVQFSEVYYRCLEYNGPDYNEIRVPGVQAWVQVETTEWIPNQKYEEWAVVSFEGDFYTLSNRPMISVDMTTGEETDPMDWTTNPLENDSWGAIAKYDPDVNTYELSRVEFVVFGDAVYCPVMNPNADEPKEGHNIKLHDPRNANVKKHLLRLAVYELHKLISPDNVSSARITDYETSILWLRDASRLKLNPGLPRKIDDEGKPVADFAVASYIRDYDPYKNPWHI